MRRSVRRTVDAVPALLMVGLLIPLAGAGCAESDWDDPDYIIQRLEEGNKVEQQLALKKLGQLESDKKKREAAPVLAEMYLAGEANSRDAVELLVDMRPKHDKAKEAFLNEIKNNEEGFAGPAATALGQMGATDTIDRLLEFYRNNADNDVKLAVLRGLRHMPREKMVEPLAKTMKMSVDNNDIKLHRLSCEILGDIGQKSPDALDEDDLRLLVRGLYLTDQTGGSSQRPCSIAIQKVGKPVVPILVETFNDDNDDVNRLLRKYRADSPKFIWNRAQVGAVQRLSDLRAEEAPELYIENLEKERSIPEYLPRDYTRHYLTMEAQFIDEMMLGLGEMGASDARELLEKVLTGEQNEKWSPILDYRSELQLRQDAGRALVRLGNRESVSKLKKMAMEGVVKRLERRAKAAEESDERQAMKPERRYQFNWMMAKAFANLGTGEHKSGMKELQKRFEKVDKMKEDLDFGKLKGKLENYMNKLELAEKCGGKSGPDAQASCYAGTIDSSDSKAERQKAAWELMRLDSSVAGPAITEHLDTEHLPTRRILVMGLYRNPHEEAIGTIDQIIEDESERAAKDYKLSRFRLKLLRAWLKNHFA